MPTAEFTDIIMLLYIIMYVSRVQSMNLCSTFVPLVHSKWPYSGFENWVPRQCRNSDSDLTVGFKLIFYCTCRYPLIVFLISGYPVLFIFWA